MTTPDTSAEVERIRALWTGVGASPEDYAPRPGYGYGTAAWWETGADGSPSETVEARWWDTRGRDRGHGAPAHIATLLAALDRVTAERDAHRDIIEGARYCLSVDNESAARACLDGNGLEPGVAEDLQSDLDRLYERVTCSRRSATPSPPASPRPRA